MAWINEIYDTLYDPDTICVACISHGKDSNAMLRAIKLLGLPLHRIVTSDVWATQDIPADLPPMWEWKKEADQIIKTLYGIEVEHICAMQKEAFPISEQCKAEVEAHANEDLSQFVQVERESKMSGGVIGSATKICSTARNRAVDGMETSKGFLASKALGAKSSNLRKLTYEDIFYRRFKEGTRAHTASRQFTIHTAEGSSRIYGFPMQKGNWCTSSLKPPLRIPDLCPKRTVVPTTQAFF